MSEGVRRWESVAQEWVTVVPGSRDIHGTVLAVYANGQTLRVGAWILHREEC